MRDDCSHFCHRPQSRTQKKQSGLKVDLLHPSKALEAQLHSESTYTSAFARVCSFSRVFTPADHDLHPLSFRCCFTEKKRLVQGPNSYFMDVKCPGCFNITTVFSHAQTVVICGSCSTVLCQPTGGKARLTEGESITE